jgi:hypothetical protein
MVEALVQQLENSISRAGIAAEVMACTIEKDPFIII